MRIGCVTCPRVSGPQMKAFRPFYQLLAVIIQSDISRGKYWKSRISKLWRLKMLCLFIPKQCGVATQFVTIFFVLCRSDETFTSQKLTRDPLATDSSKLLLVNVYFTSFITHFDEIATYFTPTLSCPEFIWPVFFTITARYCPIAFSVDRFTASTFIRSFLTDSKYPQVFSSKNPEVFATFRSRFEDHHGFHSHVKAGLSSLRLFNPVNRSETIRAIFPIEHILFILHASSVSFASIG